MIWRKQANLWRTITRPDVGRVLNKRAPSDHNPLAYPPLVMGTSMPIDRLLQQSSLPPDKIACLKVAYARTLSSLGLVDRNDPITEMVAKKTH
jgi:hypothetical protein